MVKKLIMIDWRAMKYYHKRAPLVLIFAVIVGIVLSAELIIPSCAMMSFMFSINTFAVEEKGELNNLYLTLPVKRSSIVTGRFVLSIIMGLCGQIAGIPLMILTNHLRYSNYRYSASSNIFIFAFAYLLFSICNLAMYPVLFRFGFRKGKVLGFYLPIMAIGIMFGMFQVLLLLGKYEALIWDILTFSSEHMLMVNGGLILLATMILLISYILSKYLYKKRDFEEEL